MTRADRRAKTLRLRRQREELRAMLKEDKRNPAPEAKVMLLGLSDSGKTTHIAATNHLLSIGGDGIRLQPYPTTLFELGGMVSDILQGTPELPKATRIGQEKQWQFRFQAVGDKRGEPRTLFRLAYTDYAGEFLDQFYRLSQISGQAALSAQSDFLLQALAQHDVVIGVLDGEKVERLMLGRPDDDFQQGLFATLSVLSQRFQKPGHLILTKWDRVSRFGFPAVVEKLKTFGEVERIGHMSGVTPLRLIPVSSFGVNDYLVRETQDSDGDPAPWTRNGDRTVPWKPYYVDMPLACTVVDFLTSGLQQMENHVKARPGHRAVEFITSPVFLWMLGGLGLAAVAPHVAGYTAHKIIAMGGVSMTLTVPPERAVEVLKSILHGARDLRTGPQRQLLHPSPASGESKADPDLAGAMRRAIAYCGNRTAELESTYPDCILSPGAAT